MKFSFELVNKCEGTNARVAHITTAHAHFATPRFMPVGTWGAVRYLEHSDLENAGVPCILGNTYHLYLRPGVEILKKIGGYHKLIKWPHAILTDSGGFQIFSLPGQRILSEDGVTFRSYVDHSWKHITPELAIQIQETIGSDIMMALDVCVPSTSSRDISAQAMERTHRWANRCVDAKLDNHQALFGIVQGSLFEDLRIESASYLKQLPFQGFAIGGLAVGEQLEERIHFTALTAQQLPWDKPRYLMGVGTPLDLLEAVHSGIDIFDCIIPTNHAKQGICYTWHGKKKLKKPRFSISDQPISLKCPCPVCKRYSTAYIHQLLKCEEFTGYRLIAIHNTWFYEELMREMRYQIKLNTFLSFYNQHRVIFSQECLDI